MNYGVFADSDYLSPRLHFKRQANQSEDFREAPVDRASTSSLFGGREQAI